MISCFLLFTCSSTLSYFFVLLVSSSILRCCFFFLMIRRPPRSTRTDTLFPYTTLFRSRLMPPPTANLPGGYDFAQRAWFDGIGAVGTVLGKVSRAPGRGAATPSVRSEERRVGKECVSTCRSRWSPYHYKKKKHRINKKTRDDRTCI